MKKNIFCFMICVIFGILTLGCSDNDSKEDDYLLAQIDASNLPKENRPMTMFEDDESPSRMYDNNDRWFRVNEPLQIIQKGKDSVQISLYSPVGLSNVKVYAKLRNYDKRFLIYNFSKIPAFHRSFHKIPLADKTNQYEQESGGAVTIERIEGFSADDIKFSLQSDDLLFQKFKRIKSSRLVEFSDIYHLSDPNPNSYLPMNPVLAKEAITMIINFSYAISHPIFYSTFINYDLYQKEKAAASGTKLDEALDWHGNMDDANGLYDYLTKDQIDQAYNTFIDGRKLNMAMVGGEKAWGGGPLVSQWESDYVAGHYKGNMFVWSHEYSHHSGYSHSSNLCSSVEESGLQEMFVNFYKYLIYLNDLPFNDPDILKTYTKSAYLRKSYDRPVFKIQPLNPFLVKYKGEGKWR